MFEAYMRLVDKAVLKVIEENQQERLTQPQIAMRVEVSTKTVWSSLKRLSEMGFIRPRGNRQNRAYELVRHADKK